jgi:hypothetical protein
MPPINYAKNPSAGQGSNGTGKRNGTGVLTEALRLTKLGYWVVPCDGKKPVGPDWQGTRRTSTDLWRELHLPGKNIALVLNQSNLIDVECDSEASEVALQEMFGGTIPPTPTWQSKRGLHRLFVRPQGMPGKAVWKLDGIEFRGLGTDKGAVSVIPPSIHPDGPMYRWLPGLGLGQVKPAELPPQITERLRTAKPAAPSGKGGMGDLTEGRRNTELFKHACSLLKSKLPEEMIPPIIHAMNANLCKPPLVSTEVVALLKSALSKKGDMPEKAGDALVKLVLANAELWHTPDDRAFATITRNGHSEHWPLRSKSFKRWLCKEYYDQEGTTVGSQTLQDAITMLEGKATFDGKEYPVSVRVAGHEGKVYLDLSDEGWRAIEIDAQGWRVVTDCPVRFRRLSLMKPLAEPVPGGSVEDLNPFVNMDDDDWCVFKGFLFDLLRPEGPRMVLQVSGEQGAAKTTLLKILRWCLDPSECESRAAPHTERDLRIAANNGWLCAFDNLSYITPDMSDAFCRLASGGGFGVRSHYEDEEETVFNAQRPIVLNGIEEIGTRADLLDRSAVLHLPRIEDTERKSEEEFAAEIGKILPSVLGALLDAVSAALRNLPSVRANKPEGGWPRMIDFAQWVTAAEESLGMKEGQFLDLYRANREAASEVILESSPVARALMAMLAKAEGRKFNGPAEKLWGELGLWAESQQRGSTRNKAWPKNARALSGMLTRLSPSLRKAGMTIERDLEDKVKVWHIAQEGDQAGAKEPMEPQEPQKMRSCPGTAPRDGTRGTTEPQKPQEPQKMGSSPKTLPKGPLSGLSGVDLRAVIREAMGRPVDYGESN